MKQMLQITLDEAAMADLGIPLDERDSGWGELPVDPFADDHDAFLSLYTIESPADGLMRDAIDRAVGIRDHISALQAEEHRTLAHLSELARTGADLFIRPDRGENNARELAHRTMVAELAMVMRVSDRTMASRITEADLIVRQFPNTLEKLASGSISAGHVRVIVQHGVVLVDDETRAEYEAVVLQHAVEVTPGRLRRTAELTAARLGTEIFQERHERAAAGRSVRINGLPNGMSEVILLLPSLLAVGVWDRLTKQAKALSRAGDPRTFDQLRSDLAAELLLAGELSSADGAPHGAVSAITAEVAIVIPALTLLGHSDEPATLAGSGPIGLEEARALAAEAPSMIRILTHPISNLVLSVDTYRPSEQLRRFLRIRDGRCRFPTCNRPASGCDLDHTIAAEVGGATTAENLAHLCRSDHTLKHHGGWSVRQTSPGVLEWTSPNGLVRTDRPDPTVRFAA